MCYRSSGTHPDAGAGADAAPGERPNTTLTDKPAALGNAAAVRFTFTSTVAGSSFVCSLDAEPFAACTSPYTVTLEEGQHTFAVAAVAGTQQDDTPETWTFAIDLTPPDTMITDGPSGSVNNSEATFSFTATETGSTFECRFDGGAFAACASGSAFTGFTVGSHTFEVRAVDAAGNPDPSPAMQTWTVDQTSPQTTIVTGPDALTNLADPSFTFSSDKPGSTFMCQLDAQAAGPCASPKAYAGLPDGDHTFTVTATDAAGNPDPSPATLVWTIDTMPPTITLDSGPAAGSTTGPAVAFTFSSPENAAGKPGGAEGTPAAPAVTFECQLDASAVAACDSPKAYAGLSSGSHTFQVRGVDRATNRSDFVVRTWTVDASKPTVTVSAPRDGGLTKGSGQIAFAGSETGMTFACMVDGTAVTPCASPVAFSYTTDASHTFVVTGTARGVTSDPVTVTWRADGVLPTVTIDNPAQDGVTTGPSVSVAFSSEMGATFACKVGAGAFNPCTSPLSLLLADGAASVTVHATDAAGNVSTDVRRTWTVDATGPTVSMTVTPLANGATRANAQVTYSSLETGVTFECRAYLQGTPTPPAFAACAATGITLGRYGFNHGAKITIDVRGRDTFLNPGTPATTNATVDERGPVITITSPGARTGASGTLTFTYDNTVDGSGTFTCSVLDVAGTVVKTAACTTAGGMAFGPLAAGSYTAHVDGVDGVNNTGFKDQPFVVDTTGPTMSALKCSSPLDSGRITCDFSSNAPDVATYHCRVDSSAFVECKSGTVTFAEQSQGAHTVTVFATDDVGNDGAAIGFDQNVRYNFGDIVVLGHDFTGVSDARPGASDVLGNAFKTSYVIKQRFGRPVSVLEWCGNCDLQKEEPTLRQAIKDQGVAATFARTKDTDPATIAKQLVGKDVFLVPDQNGLATMAELGKNINTQLRTFVANGGLIVLLDGSYLVGGKPVASQTAQMLVGAGLLNSVTYTTVAKGFVVRPNRVAFDNRDPLLVGFTLQSVYDAPDNTVFFTAANGVGAYEVCFNGTGTQIFALHECVQNGQTACSARP
jgi:hypothetical protein